MPPLSPSSMQAPEPRYRLQNGLALAAVTAGLDQTSKWAIMQILDLKILRRVEILPFLDFAFIWNYGISYGLFSSSSETARWLLIGLTLAVTAYLARLTVSFTARWSILFHCIMPDITGMCSISQIFGLALASCFWSGGFGANRRSKPNLMVK